MAPAPLNLTSPSPSLPQPRPSPRLPFVQGPSRITLHRDPASPTVPQTALLLSMPLTQKLAALLTVSREISSIAKQVLHQSSPDLTTISVDEATKLRVEQLEEQYEMLRLAIEEEIEIVFINAGFLPPRSLADMCSSSQAVPSSEFEMKAQEQWPWQRKVSWERAEPLMLTPIGMPQAIVPRTPAQRKRMREWNWEKGWWGKRRREDEDEEMVSPGCGKRRRVEEDQWHLGEGC